MSDAAGAITSSHPKVRVDYGEQLRLLNTGQSPPLADWERFLMKALPTPKPWFTRPDKLHPLVRFAEKIEYPPGDCWVWSGSKMKSGYGRFLGYHRRVCFAHRFSYEQFVGAIPRGYAIDHLCRNRACVNPEHLEAVTLKANILRGNGWAGRKARTTHCPDGHAYTPDNTIYWRGRRSCKTCKYARNTARRRRRRAERLVTR